MEDIWRMKKGYIFEDVLRLIEHSELSYDPIDIKKKDELASLAKRYCFMSDQFKDNDIQILNVLYKKALRYLYIGECVSIYTTSRTLSMLELTPKGRTLLLCDVPIETKYSDIA